MVVVVLLLLEVLEVPVPQTKLLVLVAVPACNRHPLLHLPYQ